jgi:hypothetical protein
MAKQPEFRKYLPLEEWFRKRPTTAEHIELTFYQVEAILGTPLPKSATPTAIFRFRMPSCCSVRPGSRDAESAAGSPLGCLPARASRN